MKQSVVAVPGASVKRQARFQFVIDELLPIRPAIKQAFGLTYVYLDEKLIISLRDSVKQPQYNGVWLFTQAEHIESLRGEFPLLPRRYFWRSKKSGSGWVILSSTLEDFEDYPLQGVRADSPRRSKNRQSEPEDYRRSRAPNSANPFLILLFLRLCNSSLLHFFEIYMILSSRRN